MADPSGQARHTPSQQNRGAPPGVTGMVAGALFIGFVCVSSTIAGWGCALVNNDTSTRSESPRIERPVGLTKRRGIDYHQHLAGFMSSELLGSTRRMRSSARHLAELTCESPNPDDGSEDLGIRDTNLGYAESEFPPSGESGLRVRLRGGNLNLDPPRRQRSQA